MSATLPKFCPTCGLHHSLFLKDAHPHCEACGTTHWENDRPVAVMMLPIIRERGVHSWFLITHTGRESDFAFPAGFVEMGESAEEAAIRELHEETGVIYTGPASAVATKATGRGQLLVFVLATAPVGFHEVTKQFVPTPEAAGWTASDPVGWRHPLHREFAERFAL